MVRARRGNTSRPSRDSGKVSGVTYVTDPSGTTITGPNITTAIEKSASFRTVPSGATITSSGVARTNGYMPQFVTNDLVVVTGTTTITGLSSDQSFTGISTILYVLTQINLKTSAVTRLRTCVSAGNDAEWPTAGTSAVSLYVTGSTGAVHYTDAVSLHYLAIGTA